MTQACCSLKSGCTMRSVIRPPTTAAFRSARSARNPLNGGAVRDKIDDRLASRSNLESGAGFARSCVIRVMSAVNAMLDESRLCLVQLQAWSDHTIYIGHNDVRDAPYLSVDGERIHAVQRHVNDTGDPSLSSAACSRCCRLPRRPLRRVRALGMAACGRRQLDRDRLALSIEKGMK